MHRHLVRLMVATAGTIVLTQFPVAQSSTPRPPPKHVTFSTFIGGEGFDSATSVAVDSEGRVYLGSTTGAGVPTTADALRRTASGNEGYLAIFSPSGALLYATFIGGSSHDGITDIALDASGNIYLTGSTQSADFPTTAGAYDRTCASDGACTGVRFFGLQADTFVMKLAPLGRGIVYSTFLGGSDHDAPDGGIAVDAAGQVHVAGLTYSRDFPWTPGAPGQGLFRSPSGNEYFDGFYSRLSADGSRLLYSTYLGGTQEEWTWAVAVDASGNAYIGGQTNSPDFPTRSAMQPVHGGSWDGWIARVTAAGAYDYASYLGGESSDVLRDITTKADDAYIALDSCSQNFPVPKSGSACTTHIIKLAANGSFARTLTVPDNPGVNRIVVDSYERAYFLGTSHVYANYRTTADAMQPQVAGDTDIVLAIFDMREGQPDSPSYATFFGGWWFDSASGLAVDASGNTYIAGATYSGDFPVVNAADNVFLPARGETEGFLLKLGITGMPRRDVPGEVVLWASDADTMAGRWSLVRDPGAAGGTRLFNPNAGAAKITTPLASPADYVEFAFTADAGAYRLWIRGKAQDDYWGNDSVYVQFSDSVDASGQPVWRVGTTSGTSVNLEETSNAGLAGWGWQDNGYGAGVLGPLVRFNTTGTHTVRVQVREDGFSFDQLVFSSARYVNGSPGTPKRDSIVLARSNSDTTTPPPGEDPPPSTCDPREVVIHPGVSAQVAGAWISEANTSAASGKRVRHPDAGAPKITTAQAAPANYFEVTFEAQAGVDYRLWIRGRAQNDYWGNDSVFVQFDRSVNASGSPIWRIGTTSATDVNLEECSGCGLAAWGWQDNGWGGAGVLGPTVQFATTGPQRMRVQTREDGFAIDQIVLSASQYLSTAPGAAKNDTTILPACTTTAAQ